MSWNRWTTRVLGGLLAVAALGGCKQQLFLEPGDYSDAVKFGLPKSIESGPHEAIVPPVVDRTATPPATVLDPTRPARYVTLRECIAIGLEQGNFGGQNQTNFGFKNEANETFQGRSVGGTDAIRAFSIDPAVAGADIERALSRFDARWITSMQWQKNDNPVAAQFVSFQSQNDTANFSTTLAKPLPTGGVAGITFSVNYAKFSNIPAAQQSSFVNPNYTPQLQFIFEQPLMQLFGVEVNQLTNQSPTSLLLSGLRPSGGQTTEGILLTRIRFDQAKAEFERNVNYMMMNIEAAYWNLYASYYNLYAQEEGLRQSFEGYRFTAARVAVGQDPPQQENQARAQFEAFRAQVYRARGQVLESERQLRGLLGLRSDDGFRLVPVDEPNLAPFKPDFYEAANDAVTFRPEVMLAREDVKALQLNVLLQKNLRRPDLRFFSSYNIAGIGTRLDGPSVTGPNGSIPGNAFTNFAENNFNSWTLGLRLDMPLGFRDANAAVRQSNLQMARGYIQLRDAEMKVLEYVGFQYRRVNETYAVIPPLRARRQELQIYVDRVRQQIRIGRWTSTDFFNLLQVQRDLATAIADEFRAIADYNTSLAAFEFAKGTIQRYNNVTLAEGALPPWVQKRAADHIRERTEAAILLRERPTPVEGMVPSDHSVGPAVGTPFIGNLPPFAEKRDPVPDQLPGGRPVDPKNGDALPAPRPIPGGMPMPGANPGGVNFPTPGAGLPAAPVGATNPDGPPPGDYFQPAGTLNLPRRSPIGPAGAAGGSPTSTPIDPVPGAPALPPNAGLPPSLPPNGGR